MRCRDVRRHLSAFLDGELEGEVREEIERHLERCGECMEEYKALAEAVSLVRGLPRLEAPEGLWVRIKARLEEPRKPTIRLLIGWRALAALISLIVIGAMLGLLSFHLLSGRTEEPPIGLYVSEHRALQPLSPGLPIGPVSPVAGGEIYSDRELQTLIAWHYEGE